MKLHPRITLMNSKVCEMSAVQVLRIPFLLEIRSSRVDRYSLETNRLIVRLDKLLTDIPQDAGKRRDHEQQVHLSNLHTRSGGVRRAPLYGIYSLPKENSKCHGLAIHLQLSCRSEGSFKALSIDEIRAGMSSFKNLLKITALRLCPGSLVTLWPYVPLAPGMYIVNQ